MSGETGKRVLRAVASMFLGAGVGLAVLVGLGAFGLGALRFAAFFVVGVALLNLSTALQPRRWVRRESGPRKLRLGFASGLLLATIQGGGFAILAALLWSLEAPTLPSPNWALLAGVLLLGPFGVRLAADLA